MEIVIKLTSEDLKDNIVLNTINTLFKSNKAITGNIELKPITDTPFEECDFVEDVVKPKKKVKTKEERVTELKNYANSIWASLNEKQKKSLKKFVEFYTDKIEKENFTINVENQLKKWFERDKNLK